MQHDREGEWWKEEGETGFLNKLAMLQAMIIEGGKANQRKS